MCTRCINLKSIKFLYTRYTGFKEVIKVVALPDKPSVVALIDVDKVLMGDDLIFKKYPRSRET